MKPLGFVIMNVRIPCIQGYNEDQIAIVLDDPSMKECPVILGTPTLFRAIQVMKESKINQLAIPWATLHLSYLIQGLQAQVGQEVRTGVGNKNIASTSVGEVVRVSSKFQISPFGCKAIDGRTGLLLMGYKLNVMMHGLEKKSPQLPLGVKVLSAYATLTMGSNRITVVLRNNTNEWVQVQKGVPIARMVTANMIPPADLSSSPVKTSELGRMSEEERQRMLLGKLDLSGLESWDIKAAKQARSPLTEYHNLFSLEKNEIGRTKAAEHFIGLTLWCFWWPGMTRDMINKVRNCAHCKKYEGAPPIAKLQKLPCSGPGELLYIDSTTIKETVGLHEKPVIRNVLLRQDHFLKHVVAYVVKDQKARTAAEALHSRYFGLFRAPAYLLSDKGKSFTTSVVEDLCKLYGVKKLRTFSYHAQTNGQVERMNQTSICFIGKLDEDKKACWSKHLPELLMAYNSMRSAVAGYSPRFLLFGRRLRIPVDYLFPTL